MVAGGIAGNISAEATTQTGNTFAEAMRGLYGVYSPEKLPVPSSSSVVPISLPPPARLTVPADNASISPALIVPLMLIVPPSMAVRIPGVVSAPMSSD